MTWIKTINHEDAGPELKKLWDEARSLYPPEYRVSVDAIDESHGGGISQSHTLLPKLLYRRLRPARRSPVAGAAARAEAPRDDRDCRFGHQQLLLLTGIARRVSA